jgi:heme A synthase
VTTTKDQPAGTTRGRSGLYSALIGVSSLAILCQAVWAGLFIRSSQPDDAFWVTVHARGGEVAIVFAVVATAVAFWRLRDRRDLLIGSCALVVLLILEAYIGGLVFRHQVLEVIHFPLALLLMALAVLLPVRAIVPRRHASEVVSTARR